MEVSDWRERINEVDRKILDLVNERLRYVLRLAPLKQKKKRPVREPKREEEVLDNVRQHNRGPLSQEAVCRIFEAIMGEMRAVQQAQRRGGSARGKAEERATAASGDDSGSGRSSACPS